MDTPAYNDHPVVMKARRDNVMDPIPIAVYVDGVRFITQAAGRSESVLGIWAINLLSGKRHFLAPLKSGDHCQCGCRGWCSIQPLLQAVQWQLVHMQRGRRPATSYNGQPWGKAAWMDPGKPLSYRIVLLYIKGDWAEHSHTLGLASWASKYSPCQYCSCTKAEVEDMHANMRAEPQWLLRTHEDYENACRACEVDVQIQTPEQKESLIQALRPVKAKKDIGGLWARSDIAINGVNLKKNDRLEPSRAVPDIFGLAKLNVPFTATFWRPRRGDRDLEIIDSLHHRCPLFSEELGTSPHRTLAVDALHTLFLGPILRFISCVLWRILLMNPWRVNGDLDTVLNIGIMWLNGDLETWQVQENVDLNRRVHGLTLKMMGKRMGCNLQECLFSDSARM